MRWLVVLTLATGCRALLGIEEPVGDIAGDGNVVDPDGSNEATNEGFACFGSGLLQVCPATTPALRVFTTSMTLDTSLSASCDMLVSNHCVIVGSNISIELGVTVRGVGSRALVLVATNQIQIQGILTVSSVRSSFVGAGANAGLCGGATQPENDLGGGGGAAGGSFAGRGGNGGIGDINQSAGVDGNAAAGVSALQITPTSIRAGCAGSRGGDGANTNTGSVGGAGGGALYLIAGSSIVISGSVTANGAGGSGGIVQGGGGGGGGSGGMIGLDAPTIQSSGVIAANGGGGGEGGSMTVGTAGADGGANATASAGGSGGAIDGGDGGQGSVTSAGGPGASDDGGAGGGGGGAGFIYVKTGTPTISGTTSPPPTFN